MKGQWVIFKNITIDAENFPDENFRNYILDQDYGKDGLITDTEIEGVKEITVFGMGIQDLKGIEFFRALEDLNCNNNQLTSLNVSENTAMVNLFCNNNQLTSIDLSKNTDLKGFACENNKLTTLDVSNNASLTYLYCNNNQLTSLDVSQNTLLIYLECYGNKIRGAEMDALVNSLPKLTDWGTIRVYKDEAPDGNEITPTQVVTAKAKHWNVKWWGEVADGSSDWIDYEFVPIDETNFPDENFRNYILTQDYGKDGYLTDAEIAAVETISVKRMEIQNLQGIEFFTALTYLECYENQLESLDLSKNTALEHLSCHENRLTSLDISGNTVLTYLDCSKNQLTELDVSKNTALKRLDCSENQLTSLNLSKNMDLRILNCQTNLLASLEVSNNTALRELWCRFNQLTTLDISKNTELELLDCCCNQLTALDVSKNLKLVNIGCFFNAIRVKNMDAFVKSLPDVRETGGYLIVYSDVAFEGYEERNEMTPAQADAARHMGWTVQKVVMTDEGPDAAYFDGVKVKGDLNDDDEVNIADVVILSNAILAGSTDLMYDVNGDNKVDAEDITAIVDIIATR